jgi:hypothetical protein
MAGSPTRRERRERWERIAADPDTLDTLVEHVAGGGSLVEISRTWDVPYHAVAGWVTEDPERVRRLGAAEKLRGEYFAELVVRNLRMFVDVDLADAYDAEGQLLPIDKMPEHVRRCIASIEIFEEFAGKGDQRQSIGQTRKIKTVSPERAVELMGKYRKMFVDQVEHKGKLTLEDLVGGSMAAEAEATT